MSLLLQLLNAGPMIADQTKDVVFHRLHLLAEKRALVVDVSVHVVETLLEIVYSFIQSLKTTLKPITHILKTILKPFAYILKTIFNPFIHISETIHKPFIHVAKTIIDPFVHVAKTIVDPFVHVAKTIVDPFVHVAKTLGHIFVALGLPEEAGSRARKFTPKSALGIPIARYSCASVIADSPVKCGREDRECLPPDPLGPHFFLPRPWFEFI